VVDKFILQLEEQLADRNVQIVLDDAAREWLGIKGYDKLFGARPLSRIIQEHVKKPLAEELLFGKLVKGGVVKVSVDKEKDALAFAFEEAAAAPRRGPPRPTSPTRPRNRSTWSRGRFQR
jgi:ATP-dependent Clp protease ATP-binding subunit ClpA